MKKRILSIALMLCLMLSVMPKAFAAGGNTATVYIAGTAYTQSGTTTTPTLPENVSIDWDSHKIGLNGATIENKEATTGVTMGYSTGAAGIAVLDNTNNWSLELTDTNKIAVSASGNVASYGIYAQKDLTISGAGTLEISASRTQEVSSASCYGIYANSVTVSGGTITVDAGGVTSAMHSGIVAMQSCNFTGGTTTVKNCYYAVTAYITGINISGTANVKAENVVMGLGGGGSVSINSESASVSISATETGISVNEVTISAGAIEIDATGTYGTGISVNTATNITGGTVDIDAEKFGIETTSGTITISAESTTVDAATAVLTQSGTVSLSSGTYTGDLSAGINKNNGASVANSTLTVSGGSVSGSVTTGKSSTVTVTGGSVGAISTGTDSTVSVSGTDTKVTGDITMAGTSNSDGATATLTISGGNVEGKIDAGEGTTATVSGGSFGEPVNPDYLGEGMNVELNVNGVHTYHENAEAANEAAEEATEAGAENVVIKDLTPDESGSRPEAPETKAMYTVTIDDGTTTTTKQVWEGDTIAKPTTPTKEGYVFLGWSDGSRIVSFPYTVTANVTLTAQWGKDVSQELMLMQLMGDTTATMMPEKDVPNYIGLYQMELLAQSGSFADVAKTDWFYSDVTTLVSKGVVSGYPDGSFKPYGEVTWGEALKLVMKAVGYGDIDATNGHWASGYMDMAVEKGLISGSVELDAPITRGEIADLTALALKLGEAKNAAPFADEAPASAAALYEAGIINGSADNGQLLYRAESTITRAEISAIIWRVYCAR